MKYCFWNVWSDNFFWINVESEDDVDDKHVRNIWRHFDGTWERRGVVEWLLSIDDIIDDRQRGANDGKSSALSIVCEPYIDELLEVVDDIEEREVDDCMIISSMVS